MICIKHVLKVSSERVKMLIIVPITLKMITNIFKLHNSFSDKDGLKNDGAGSYHFYYKNDQ